VKVAEFVNYDVVDDGRRRIGDQKEAARTAKIQKAFAVAVFADH